MNNNNNKSRDIFMGVVAIATLIVAIVGATLAYFSITASSNEGAVNATAAIVSIEYNDGKQVTAQANELIPATFDVVKKVYETNVKNASVIEDMTKASNLCKDYNNRQVCSAYRFTIYSDMERTITATLNNESNGFTYLSYAVYDVDKQNEDGTTGGWVELTSEGDYTLPINTCSNDDENLENCFNIEGTKKNYTPAATNSIFGITTVNGETSPKTTIVNDEFEEGHAYEIVLFIKEINENQNVDQGKQFNGTIMIDVTEGLDGASGNITGCVGEDCREE